MNNIECIEISAHNRSSKLGLYVDGRWYRFVDGETFSVPTPSDTKSLRAYRSNGLKKTHSCSCDSIKEIKTSSILAHIISEHKAQLDSDRKIWNDLAKAAKGTICASLVEDYLIYGVDREPRVDKLCKEGVEDIKFDTVKDYINNHDCKLHQCDDICSVKYGYLCGYAGCTCRACNMFSGTFLSRMLLGNWLYLLDIIHKRLRRFGKGSVLKMGIDPWSARCMWLCRDCKDYAIIRLLTKQGGEFYLCLNCDVAMDLESIDDNGVRTYCNRREDFISGRQE